MKTLVVCIDGTWNHPGQTDIDPIEDIERVSETNVLRVYRFLTGVAKRNGVPIQHGLVRALHPAGGPGEALYLSGVGSAGTVVAKAWQGATGTGTSERILEAYQFVAERYDDGDQIFAFGFSRGAFAVRSFAGFLQFAGLPAQRGPVSDHTLELLYTAYRSRGNATRATPQARSACVHFLGLWDTVGAIAFGRSFNNFHLLSPDSVKHVAHALALDEVRGSFKPEYWERSSGGTVVDEAWFAGVHSNIGGGYAEEGLSNIALAWIVAKAVAAGLPKLHRYIPGWYGENSIGVARDSNREFLDEFGLVGALVRRVFVGKENRIMTNDQYVHADVFRRITESVKVPYLPAAFLPNKQPFPNSSALFSAHQILETPDYLTASP